MIFERLFKGICLSFAIERESVLTKNDKKFAASIRNAY